MIKNILYLTVALTFMTCESDSSNYSSGSSSTSYYEEPVIQLTEKQLKQQLFDTECMSPNDYLDGEIKTKPIFKNVLSSKVKGLKLTLNISNSATLATFKNLSIHIELTSKTGSVVKSEDFVVYEYVKSNSRIKYKYEMDITNQQYKDYSRINWYIEDADCAR